MTDNISIVTPVVVQTTLQLPTGFYVMCFGLFLVFLGIFLKKALIYLAIIPCMIAVLVEPEFKDAWFQTGCVLVMLWAGLSAWKALQNGGEG